MPGVKTSRVPILNGGHFLGDDGDACFLPMQSIRIGALVHQQIGIEAIHGLKSDKGEVRKFMAPGLPRGSESYKSGENHL